MGKGCGSCVKKRPQINIVNPYGPMPPIVACTVLGPNASAQCSEQNIFRMPNQSAIRMIVPRFRVLDIIKRQTQTIGSFRYRKSSFIFFEDSQPPCGVSVPEILLSSSLVTMLIGLCTLTFKLACHSAVTTNNLIWKNALYQAPIWCLRPYKQSLFRRDVFFCESDVINFTWFFWNILALIYVMCFNNKTNKVWR